MRVITLLGALPVLTLACGGVETETSADGLVAVCIENRSAAPAGAWMCGEERVVECTAPGGTHAPTLYVLGETCGGELRPSERGPFAPGTRVIDIRDATVTIPAAPSTQVCSATLTVVDTTPPTITDRGASIWPPNHRMHDFSVADCAAVTDVCDPQLEVAFTYVASDEPLDGRGDGNTEVDAILDCDTVQVRGERQGGSDGRVYTLGVRATDGAGNVREGACTIGVSHDRGGQPRAIPSAQAYRIDAPARCNPFNP